jgi:hypothetical protein
MFADIIMSGKRKKEPFTRASFFCSFLERVDCLTVLPILTIVKINDKLGVILNS